MFDEVSTGGVVHQADCHAVCSDPELGVAVIPAPTFCPAPVTNAVLPDRSNSHSTLTDPTPLVRPKAAPVAPIAAPVAPKDNLA